MLRDIPLEVADHRHGLEQIIESLAWVYGRRGEQKTKPREEVTNEARRFQTYVAREIVGQSRIYQRLYTRRLALSFPVQVGTQLSRQAGNQFRAHSEARSCCDIGSDNGKWSGGWGRGWDGTIYA